MVGEKETKMKKRKRRKKSDPCSLLLRLSYLHVLNLSIASFFVREKERGRR